MLTLTFAKPERISRISFINAHGDRGTEDGKVRGATPCEYEIQVSMDDKTWRTFASNEGREPWTSAHGIAKVRRGVTVPEEQEMFAALEKQISHVLAKLNCVPKLPQVWPALTPSRKNQPLSTKAAIP